MQDQDGGRHGTIRGRGWLDNATGGKLIRRTLLARQCAAAIQSIDDLQESLSRKGARVLAAFGDSSCQIPFSLDTPAPTVLAIINSLRL